MKLYLVMTNRLIFQLKKSELLIELSYIHYQESLFTDLCLKLKNT